MTFHILRFPVTVRPDFLLMLLASGALMFGTWPVWAIATWWGVMFGAILLHELGHAVAARSFGLPVRGIRLHALGGDVSHGAGKPAQHLAVVVAGPAAGLAVGAAVLVASPFLGALGAAVALVVSQVLVATIGWSLFNLLPIRPLDGGNALLEVLNLGGRPATALKTTHRVGIAFGAALTIYALATGQMYVLALAAMLTYGNYAALSGRAR